MRIVLLGPPGSGKSELSEKISDHYGMPVITVASVMQRAAAEQSELGRLAKEAMDMSRVSDELLLALLRIQLPQTDLGKGFILVDLPKNAGQADVLDSVLNDLGAAVEVVLNLEVDRDELMERLVGRIACDQCGAQYNLYINPPMVDGVCDACGARVVRRPDDYEETISNRLRVYEGQMGPLLQYYSLGEKLHRVEADSGIPKAWKAVRKLLDSLPPSAAPGSVMETPAAVEEKAVETAPAKSDKPVKRAGMIKAAAKKADSEKRVVPAKSKGKGGKKSTAKSKPARSAESVEPKKAVPKKAAAKKAATQQTTAKKTTAKKAVVKKSVAKKAVAKKVPAKKAVAKKAVAKKTAANKVAAKKTVAKKTAVKKAAARKPVPAKSAAKKATAKKAAVKKVTPKKQADKAVAKKAIAKKTAVRKASAKQVAPKKTVSKKPAGKKVAAKKTGARVKSK